MQVNRNGLRAIAFGTGAPDSVSIRYLTASSDIKAGDLLVSSGIGGGFPFGYPVAKVEKIVNDPNESFLDISATPVARALSQQGSAAHLAGEIKHVRRRKKPAEIKKPVVQKNPVEPKKPAAVRTPAASNPSAEAPRPVVVEPAKPAEGEPPP